jgi:hypothetical protein
MRPHPSVPALAGALLLIVMLRSPTDVIAQQIVRFGAVVMLATETAPPANLAAAQPDDRLVRLLPRLRQVLRYEYYTPLGRLRAEAPLGATESRAVGDARVELTPESLSGDTVRLKLRIDGVTATVAARQRAPAIVGGPRYKNGVLIVVVWAHPLP